MQPHSLHSRIYATAVFKEKCEHWTQLKNIPCTISSSDRPAQEPKLFAVCVWRTCRQSVRIHKYEFSYTNVCTVWPAFVASGACPRRSRLIYLNVRRRLQRTRPNQDTGSNPTTWWLRSPRNYVFSNDITTERNHYITYLTDERLASKQIRCIILINIHCY